MAVGEQGRRTGETVVPEQLIKFRSPDIFWIYESIDFRLRTQSSTPHRFCKKGELRTATTWRCDFVQLTGFTETSADQNAAFIPASESCATGVLILTEPGCQRPWNHRHTPCLNVCRHRQTLRQGRFWLSGLFARVLPLKVDVGCATRHSQSKHQHHGARQQTDLEAASAHA